MGKQKRKTTKRALFSAVLSMLLCLSMLIGSTFAWFTDSKSSSINKITAGTLKVTLERQDGVDWVDVSDQKLFANIALWEPGVLAYENVRVGNAGNLALKYQLVMNFANATKVPGTDKSLLDVLKIALVPGGVTAADRATMLSGIAAGDWKTLETFKTEGMLLAGADPTVYGIVLYWAPGAFDNDYNMKDGQPALTIDLGLMLNATQVESEYDSFDNTYDAAAPLPQGVAMSSAAVDTEGKTTAETTLQIPDQTATVAVPAGAQLVTDASEIKVVFTPTAVPSGIALQNGETADAVDIHVEGLDAANTQLVKVTMQRAAKQPSYTLYHNAAAMHKLSEMPTVPANNDYYYDFATGVVTLWTKDFSPFTEVLMHGNQDWYVGHESDAVYTVSTPAELLGVAEVVNSGENFSGKTIQLGADIDMSGIDRWTSFGFEKWVQCPSFDGQNHKISNLKMRGASSVGFIGQMLNTVTVKNLTFENPQIQSTGSYCGIVCGYQYGHLTLDNVKVLGGEIVTSSKWGNSLGGLVGFSCQNDGNNTLTINKCTVDGIKIVGLHSIGGLVGVLKYAGSDKLTVNDCTVQNVTLQYKSNSVGAQIVGCGASGYHAAGYTGNGVTAQSGNTIEKFVG